jgi:hypothetical protein
LDFAGQAAFANLSSTFGKQSQQAQTAISAYNSGVTEIVVNFIGPPISTEPPVVQGPPKEPPVFKDPGPVGPPVHQGPPTEPPVFQPPSSITAGLGPHGVPELVINLGGASGSGSSSGSTAAEIVVNLGQGSGSSSASHEEVQINLGNGSSGTQITIDATQGKNGGADQVTINLNQQKTNNYELILNLLAATSEAQSSSSNALSVSA